MTSITSKQPVPAGAGSPRFDRILVWQRPVRIFHWLNALAITVLFLTGLFIATPILSSNGEPWQNFLMGRIRQIHFATAFIFIVLFFWRAYWFFAGNEYARSGFPYFWRRAWWSDLFSQAWRYARLDFGQPHVGHNGLAGLSYSLLVAAMAAQILLGLALYSESDTDGFWGGLAGWVIPLLGGSFRTHMWHHLIAWSFIWFAIVHIYIVMVDSHQYRNGLVGSMITGMKFREHKEDEPN